MYTNLYSLLRYSLWKGGKQIKNYLEELEQSQWMSQEAIKNMQLAKIQQLLCYAYDHVPFYKDRYDKERIHPKDIRSLQDFQSIPYLTRDDVVNNLELLLAKGYKYKLVKDKTGGSTGRPMTFYMDQPTAWWSNAVETRYRGWHGVRPGDKRAWVWGALKDFPPWQWKDRLKTYANRYRYLNAHTMLPENMLDFAKLLQRWKPAMFRAYPSAMYIFAKFLQEQGINDIQPKLIETTGEKLQKNHLKLISEVFNCRVAEHYSSWEIYDIAYQCPEKGLHVSEDRYLELVNEKGKEVSNGEIGEVVLTSLTQYGMPFIRYKNEDLGIYEGSSCKCGRGMPVLREVVGRFQDLLVRPDGQAVYGALVDYITHDKTEVERFQVYQPDKNNIEIRIVPKTDIDESWIEQIISETQPFFGEGMDITVKMVAEIPLTTSGKLQTVISKVRPDAL